MQSVAVDASAAPAAALAAAPTLAVGQQPVTVRRPAAAAAARC
jgi:hypothetical protein